MIVAAVTAAVGLGGAGVALAGADAAPPQEPVVVQPNQLAPAPAPVGCVDDDRFDNDWDDRDDRFDVDDRFDDCDDVNDPDDVNDLDDRDDLGDGRDLDDVPGHDDDRHDIDD
ncbi:hypothetical protein GCM10010470_58220 [Saccharopolyspora taberi]|uniref:Uncharacterized protein n=1 Tax=Saccharopolyspora taberi TaxID=60895 RepID=A0ABN3VMF1_9PSEU